MAHVTNLENEELLDNLTVSYFEILQELLEERHKLELAMRGGFLEIAKSRHNMGSRCVSSIQLPSPSSDKCYQADFKVETSTLNEGPIEKVSFYPLTNVEDASVQKESGSGGLRKRIHEGQTPDLIKHVNSNLDSDQATGQKKTVKTNSLKWFGILLPNSLRSAMKSRTALQMDWIKSQEGTNIMQSLLDANTNGRRTFGFLEKPVIDFDAEEVGFKIFLYGKAGIGKSDTVALLTGQEIPAVYTETEGITVMVTYWPAKLSTSKIILFRLEFWDVGDFAIKKFSHVLPSCEEEVNAIMYTFSFTDRKSFEEIPNLMSKIPKSNILPCRFAIGTRFDHHISSDVTLKDITEFEEKYKIPVIKIRNNFNLAYPSKQLQKFRLGEAAHALNKLCNDLWNYRKVEGSPNAV